MKKPSKVIAKRVASSSKSVVRNINPLDFVREYISFKKCVEEQITERNKIEAERDKVIKAIEAEKEVIMAYFNMRFKERKETIDRLFGTLDKGIKSKNNEIIDKALGGIVVVIKDNPLKDFEHFRKQFKSGDTIEI